FDLREVEQVVDETRQLLRFAVDDAVVLVRALAVLQPPELERLGEQLDERERRLQIVRDARHEVRFHLRDPHLARRGADDEEDADGEERGEQPEHRALRTLARGDDRGDRLRAVAGAQPPLIGLAILRRDVLLQLGVEEDERERPFVDPRRRRGPGRRVDDASVAVEDRHRERGEAGRPFRFLQAAGDEGRQEPLAETVLVDAQRDEAGQLVARRRLPADLRLEVHVTPVDDRVEERDRMLLRRELAHAADDERAFRHLRREAVRLAVVGEHLAAVQRRVIGPDVEARDEWFGGESLLEGRRDEREIERFGLRLADAQQDVDVRRLQRVLQPLRETVGRFLRELAQDDRRRLAERRDRSELEVEEAGDGNQDGDRESRREPDAAITQPFHRTLLLRRGLRLVRQEALNLFHGVVDLDVERHLAERRGRAAGVAGDAVVLARRRVRIVRAAAAALAGRWYRVAFRRRDQLFAHPALVAAEVEHRRRVGDAGVRARRVTVIDEPLVEIALRFRVDLVAEVHVLSLRRVLRVHLLGGRLVGRRLAAAVIAHQDHVLEAGRHRLIGDALEDRLQQFGREADRTGQIRAGVVRRVRQHRQVQRVAEAQRDRLDDRLAHQRVAAVDVLRPALLGSARVDERRRLALGEGLLHFGPRHHREFDVRLLGGGRFLGLRERGRGDERARGDGKGSAPHCVAPLS